MRRLKLLCLASFLAAPVLAAAPGCSDECVVAASADELVDAQKQRNASLVGETGGAAPSKSKFRRR
ncbi:hypothetical protein EP7_003499 [Isosphaeraceae bacterium EP7]